MALQCLKSPKNALGETLEQPGVTGITHLPEELLVRIVSFLPLNGNQLAPLCRVSRLFQRLVEPHLYSTITLTIDCFEKRPDSASVRDEGEDFSLPHFSRLFHTLSKYPSLRTYARTLWLKVGHCDGVWQGHAGYYPSLSLQILLLKLLPSLEDLRLNPPPVFSELPNMHSLRSLHLDFEALYFTPKGIDLIDLEWNTQSARYKTLKSCLIIPTLHTLKVVGLDPHSNDIPLVPFPHFVFGSSHIDDLQIIRCGALTSDVLVDILISIRALKRFVLECSWQFGFEDGDPSYNTLGRALEPHRVHLEELIIAGSDCAQFEDTQSIGSLRDYFALKRLAIPVHLLAGYGGPNMKKATEGLPQQLEELQLQYCIEDRTSMSLDVHVQFMLNWNLVAKQANFLPALKREIWWYQQPPEVDTEGLHCCVHLQVLLPLCRRICDEFQMGWSAQFQSTPFGTPFEDGKSFDKWHPVCQQRS